MPRETVVVTIPEFTGTRNRDKGKLFRLTEWDSDRAEKWGLRMLFAANKGGGSVPMELAGVGMEGIAIIGINTFLRGEVLPETMIPLLDELLTCVKVVRNPKSDTATDLLPGDIEEVATRMWLRGEVLTLHLNFSVGAALSALYKKMMTPLPNSSKPPGEKISSTP